jgi:hypothetical protein
MRPPISRSERCPLLPGRPLAAPVRGTPPRPRRPRVYSSPPQTDKPDSLDGSKKDAPAAVNEERLATAAAATTSSTSIPATTPGPSVPLWASRVDGWEATKASVQNVCLLIIMGQSTGPLVAALSGGGDPGTSSPDLELPASLASLAAEALALVLVTALLNRTVAAASSRGRGSEGEVGAEAGAGRDAFPFEVTPGAALQGSAKRRGVTSEF